MASAGRKQGVSGARAGKWEQLRAWLVRQRVVCAALPTVTGDAARGNRSTVPWRCSLPWESAQLRLLAHSPLRRSR